MEGASVVEQLTSLHQYSASGQRAPHKPLLVLLALGQFEATGSSTLPWSVVEERLGALLAEFGTPTRDGKTLPSYPFTRLRADGVWQLNRDVPNDNVGPLRVEPIDGSFTPEVEDALRQSPGSVYETARVLVEQQFPFTIAPDVLAAAGLDPDVVFGTASQVARRAVAERRRDPRWRHAILEAWDRSCAFCGFDGALGGAPVGLEAAHVRWFTFDGPDAPDNGLALCSLHHKLLDRGVLGMSDPETVQVSTTFSAVSEIGKAVYDLHGKRLRPRPGTRLPATAHIDWHQREVFKGAALTA